MAKYGWATKAMFSFMKKEATYDAAVTINGTNWFTLTGAKVKMEWPDVVNSNGDTISGYEFPTQQEIAQNDVKITITEDRCHASFLGGALAMAAGASTATRDGGNDAYVHYAIPGTLNANVSINGMVTIGGTQYLYKGLVAESIKISGAKEGYISCELVLRGSGTRATDATAYETPVAEPWLKVRNVRSWLESGSDITIDATPAQGAENISSATPDPLATRFRSFEFGWTNNIEKMIDNVGIDCGKREATCKFSLTYADGTELGFYENQTNLAFEINLDSGTLVDTTGGAYKWGFILIIPSGRLKAAPIPDGTQTGILTADYEFLVMDDLTNPAFQTYVYNAIPAYIA